VDGFVRVGIVVSRIRKGNPIQMKVNLLSKKSIKRWIWWPTVMGNLLEIEIGDQQLRRKSERKIRSLVA
jgi:hypothetical protein